MTVCLEQEVTDAGETGDSAGRRDAGRGLRRVVVAGPAGLALMLAGGGLLIRVALLAFHENDLTGRGWLFTAVACLLAGVALVLIALPRVVATDTGEDTTSGAVGSEAPERG